MSVIYLSWAAIAAANLIYGLVNLKADGLRPKAAVHLLVGSAMVYFGPVDADNEYKGFYE